MVHMYAIGPYPFVVASKYSTAISLQYSYCNYHSELPNPTPWLNQLMQARSAAVLWLGWTDGLAYCCAASWPPSDHVAATACRDLLEVMVVTYLVVEATIGIMYSCL